MQTTKLALALLVILLCSLVLAASNELTFEESTEPETLNKCYIPKSLLLSLPQSKFYMEGPNILTQEDGQTVASIDPEATGTSSGSGTTGSGLPTPFSPAPAKQNNLLYGQYLEDGKPVGGEDIIIQWEDSKGQKRAATTTTLTRDEATKLGDPGLEGYWFLNKELYSLSEDMDITVTRVKEEVAAPPPEEPEEPEEEPVKKTVEEPRIERLPVPVEPESAYDRAKAPFRTFLTKAWPFLLAIVFLIALTPFTKRAVEKGIDHYRLSKLAGKFGKDAKRLSQRRASSFLEEAPTIARDATLQELASNFLSGKDYALVMDSNDLVGIVTVADLLEKTRFGEESLAGTPVERIMTKQPVAIIDTMQFDTLISVANKHRVIPVQKGKHLLGVVTRRSLLAALDSFFSLNLVDARGMPTVRDHLEEATTISKDAHMKDVLAAAREAHADLLLTTEKERFVGVLGEHELLEELYNYTSLMEKMDAERLMIPHQGTIAGATLYEANKDLLARNERTLPVLSGGEIKGVLRERVLLKAIHTYFNDLLATQKG
ncbi:CBS domain-containing protein [Candidatus Woesearchaeota archaeon]|nr:CBS domain-containing protein [Candidatus Woesearchaeota archaeon]